MSKFLTKLFSVINPFHSLIIEDDGRVCYAYLFGDEEIIGDVWLYNQREPPNKAKWDRRTIRFLNPSEFLIDNLSISPIKYYSEVDAEWDLSPDNQFLNEVNIFIRGNLVAKLKPYAKPGWSTMVKKDGPLAKVLL